MTLPRWRRSTPPTLGFKNALQKPTSDVTDTTSIFFFFFFFFFTVYGIDPFIYLFFILFFLEIAFVHSQPCTLLGSRNCRP